MASFNWILNIFFHFVENNSQQCSHVFKMLEKTQYFTMNLRYIYTKAIILLSTFMFLTFFNFPLKAPWEKNQNEILHLWHILYTLKDWCMFSFWSSITSVGGHYPILEHQICVCVYYKQINVVILNIITLWCTIEWPNVKVLW